MRATLQTLRYDPTVQTVRGFLATARTMVRERLKVDPAAISRLPGAYVEGQNGEVYDRAEYVGERVLMIQRWADYLDKLAASVEIAQFKTG
ncbi:hypothetical protein QTI19_24075 [Variovorax sp. J22R203]|nr:hypothetical protein [Variovorax sp. J22R203]